MIPHFFEKLPVPKITKPGLLKAIAKVKASKSQRDALETAYDIVTTRYGGKRFHTYLFFWKAFQKNPNRLWERNEFLHCTHMNYLLRLLLIESGWFKEREIKLGYALVWYVSIHQYLKVKVGEKWTAVDPWLDAFGGEIGEFRHGFGKRRL